MPSFPQAASEQRTPKRQHQSKYFKGDAPVTHRNKPFGAKSPEKAKNHSVILSYNGKKVKRSSQNRLTASQQNHPKNLSIGYQKNRHFYNNIFLRFFRVNYTYISPCSNPSKHTLLCPYHPKISPSLARGKFDLLCHFLVFGLCLIFAISFLFKMHKFQVLFSTLCFFHLFSSFEYSDTNFFILPSAKHKKTPLFTFIYISVFLLLSL